AFLRELGVSETTPEDAYVDAALADRVLADLGKKSGDPAFGLTLARIAVTYPLGFFDHLVWPGATVRDALLRSQRFYALLTKRSALVLEEHGTSTTILQRVEPGAPRGTVLTELAFASFVLRSRRAAGAFVVRSLRFVHEPPTEAIAQYTEIFEAPVTFGQSEDA